MRVQASVRRARRLSLTSLIDVIFLLLLFFMLSSTFTRFAEVELTGAQATTGSSGTPDVLVRLADDGWSVNGLAHVDIASVAAEVARLEETGAESAVLLVRGEAQSQELISAIEAIRGASAIPLSVAQ
jgi:biopolymer transport protein ExbD